MNPMMAAKQRELARRKNELLITKQTDEQESEISALETDYYTKDNPYLKKAEAIKQLEHAKRLNELESKKASKDREAALGDLESSQYSMTEETIYLNTTTMYCPAKTRREYE